MVTQENLYVDNLDAQMSFIRSEEAGKFLAFLAEKDMTGAVNGCSDGTISIREILDYVSEKTGKKPILSETGVEAPYNGTMEYSIHTGKAKKLGYDFLNVRDWMFELVDYYIEMCK